MGRRVQFIESALRQALRTRRFEPARFRPVPTQRYLHNALGYVLRQEERHGTQLDPAHDGSVVPDLLGMRVLDTDVLPNLRTHLPRLQVRMRTAIAARVRGW